MSKPIALDFNDKTDEMNRANEQLANTLVGRLNFLCQDPTVRKMLKELIEVRINVNDTISEHPTFQTVDSTIGFLGVLNGMVGVLPDGPRKDWGLITAVFDDNTNELLHFEITQNPYS